MDWTSRALSYSKAPRFRLLDLPAEIRDTIFEFALTSEKSVVAFCLDEYQRDSYQEATQPALTRVNRQIRQESLPIFYSCNDIVLHTDNSKANDTQRWLACIGANLANLRRLSLWLRYVTLTNDRSAANGALCISILRPKLESAWQVDDRWEWITVTRKPPVAESDAKFLISELEKIFTEYPRCLESVEGFAGMMADLKMTYVKEKMS